MLKEAIMNYMRFLFNKITGKPSGTEPNKDYKLKFGIDGNFKIVQFTDTHEGPGSDVRTLSLMDKILDAERPELALITGDIIDGKCRSRDDVEHAIKKIVQPMEKKGIPWAVIFGNHDDEHGRMTKKDMMKLYMSFKYNINQTDYESCNRIGNFNLLVSASRQLKPVFNLYFLDSGKYAPLLIGGYAWVTPAQINWYKNTAARLKNTYGTVLPSLMFIHIPLPEFISAWKEGLVDGERLEKECSPKINSSLFKTLTNTRDVKGLFVGHDHLNNYCAVKENILLGYAGSTGYEGYGKEGVQRGARVFLINERSPETFKTWMRLEKDL